MKNFICCFLVLSVLFTCIACNNNPPVSNVQTSVDNLAEEQAKREKEEKAISEAQVVVEDFMDEFLVLNLKGMVELTDADVDYSEMSYLILDEYKREMLSEF